ncbi:MAG TPA: hypothetical protein VFU99_01450 [Gaiellaceae bacterium]|nr:hypothetical protein [Gaiellaceae bacterium]
MSDAHDPGDEPPQKVRRLEPPAPPAEEREDAAADERTSPFPYAEKFDEWVADETAASDGHERRGAAGDADGIARE